MLWKAISMRFPISRSKIEVVSERAFGASDSGSFLCLVKRPKLGHIPSSSCVSNVWQCGIGRYFQTGVSKSSLYCDTFTN